MFYLSGRKLEQFHQLAMPFASWHAGVFRAAVCVTASEDCLKVFRVDSVIVHRRRRRLRLITLLGVRMLNLDKLKSIGTTCFYQIFRRTVEV